MERLILSLLLAFVMLFTSGCGAFQTVTGEEEKRADSYENAYDLSSEKAYVWHHEGGNLADDLEEGRKGDNVFFLCPTGDINFTGEELSDTSEYPRSIWFNGEEDEAIPTLTQDDALIFISDTKVPEEIIFERFADYGYTVGVSNLTPDGGGHYYFPFAETDKDDYKYYIDPESDAMALTDLSSVTRLYLDKAGDIDVREETVSDGGTVEGLERDKTYTCTFYTGTFYQDYALKAEIRSFGSFERFKSQTYDFLHANCIRVNIPDYLVSGYYFVLGAGLFRYVAPEDEGKYTGASYDPGIDWNVPIIKYDKYGAIIYDPSLGIDQINETSDPGLSEEGEGEESTQEGGST